MAPTKADAQAAVSPDDFSCILQHVEEYRAQGDEITLNFETCPEPPSFREELQAHEARNFWPPRTGKEKDQTSPSDVSVAAKNLPALMVTKKEFDCLIDSQQLIESDDETGRLLILPDLCQDRTQ